VRQQALGRFFNAQAGVFERTQERVRRRAIVAEVIVERIERDAAPDFATFDAGFERNTRSRYDVTSAAEFNGHVFLSLVESQRRG
jgi:hypothetical protein